MPGVAQRVGTGLALLLHHSGIRRGCVVSSTPRPQFTPGKEPIPILQEAGWPQGRPGQAVESRPCRDSIPDSPARSQSLHRLSYPAHIYTHTHTYTHTTPHIHTHTHTHTHSSWLKRIYFGGNKFLDKSVREAPYHNPHPTTTSITEKRSAKCRHGPIPGICWEFYLLLCPKFCSLANSGKRLRTAWQLNMNQVKGVTGCLSSAPTRVRRVGCTLRRSVSLLMMMMMMTVMMTGTKYYQTSRRVTMTAYHNRFRYHYTAIVLMYDEIIYCVPEHNTLFSALTSQ